MRARDASLVMIEDSATEAALACAMLRAEPWRIHVAPSAEAGLALIGTTAPDAVLLDINLPDGNGLTILHRLRTQGNCVPTIMVTGDNEIATVVECMRRGAFDYVAKPFTAERLRVTVRNAVEHGRMARLVENYREPYRDGFHGMIGTSAAMVAVYRLIECAAPSDAAVFITGASGTGKELAAAALHRLSRRAGRPMVALNCAALPESLAESELFGHARGAFTGAHADRPGAVELAHEGTLFLDEVGEMPVGLQAKLLRFLQSGMYQRLGDGRPRRADVRIIAATNRDPRAMVRLGSLREDLYFRLHVIPLHLPPLAERGEDILAIARHLLARSAAAEGRPGATFSAEAESWLCAQDWPGNVRQLENVIRYAVVMTRDGRIDRTDLAAIDPGAAVAAPAPGSLAEIERAAIEAALAAHGNNVSRAARALGIDASTIHRRRRAWAKA